MVGVARQAPLAQQRKNQHYKNQPLGILDDKEAQLFINLLDRLQDTEARLFEYVKVRVEHEQEEDKRREAAEKLQEDERLLNEVH